MIESVSGVTEEVHFNFDFHKFAASLMHKIAYSFVHKLFG